jgi:apolipoprotein D and lipocalin family protein
LSPTLDLIVYLDEEYRRTIIGVPNRKYVWTLPRDPELDDADYQGLLEHVARAGYDREKVQRVPQRWTPE